MEVRQFTCELCKHTWSTSTSAAEKQKEFDENFKSPPIPPDEYVSLCDSCWADFMKRMAEHHGHGPPYA